jgi:hypothetical protein
MDFALNILKTHKEWLKVVLRKYSVFHQFSSNFYENNKAKFKFFAMIFKIKLESTTSSNKRIEGESFQNHFCFCSTWNGVGNI